MLFWPLGDLRGLLGAAVRHVGGVPGGRGAVGVVPPSRGFVAASA